MRALSLPLVIWAVPAVAFAHPVLYVTPDPSGGREVACGPEETSEPSCESQSDCDDEPGERVCRSTVGGIPYCLGPADVTCCFADRDATECPLVDGYDVTCVVVSDTADVRVVPGAAFCIYDRVGTTTCADAASADGSVALACHTTAEGGLDAPVLAENGDCDRDGIPNVQDLAPCDSAAGGRGDGGGGPDADALARVDYRGSGGCTCGVASRERATTPWLAVALGVIALTIRRRSRGRPTRRCPHRECRCGRRSTPRRRGRA